MDRLGHEETLKAVQEPKESIDEEKTTGRGESSVSIERIIHEKVTTPA